MPLILTLRRKRQMDLSELIPGQLGIHSRILDLPRLYRRKGWGRREGIAGCKNKNISLKKKK